jgi:RNA polymerase sigma factor (sigma-70 family)
VSAVSPDAYREHRDYVLAVLARRCGWLRPADREAILHDAYLVLLEKERDGTLDPAAMSPRELRAYLVQTAINKTLNEGQRAEHRRTEPLGEAALAAHDPRRPPDEHAAASLDRARLREIVAELPRRRQAIVKLRFFFERTPEEIQRYLGITERAYRRELERAMRQIAEQYELVRSGAYCDTRRSMILALVAGLSGPNRARDAREHLRSCPGCAHWAAALREQVRDVAVVLPLPPAALEPGPLERLAGALDAVRDLLAGAKHQAVAASARVDPGYASAARPGTVVAAVAGCLALGGGATYCVVEGVPGPLRGAFADERRTEPRRERSATRATPTPTAAPVRVTPTPTPRPTRTPAPRRQRQRPRRTPTPVPQPAPAAPPPVQEFGLEGSGEAITPAPAQTGGGAAADEFGP